MVYARLSSVSAHVSHRARGKVENKCSPDQKALPLQSHVSALLTNGELHQFHEVNGTHILKGIFFIAFVIWRQCTKESKCIDISQRAWSIPGSHLAHRHVDWFWAVKPATVMMQEVTTQEVQLSNAYRQSCQKHVNAAALHSTLCGVLIAVFPSNLNRRSATCSDLGI